MPWAFRSCSLPVSLNRVGIALMQDKLNFRLRSCLKFGGIKCYFRKMHSAVIERFTVGH